MLNLLSILFGAAILNNFVLVRFLGICPFLGVSRHMKSALSMGIAVTLVMVIASLATYPLYHLLLIPLGLPFLKIVSFILVVASLVQLIEMYMRRYQEFLYKSFGVYLPLITTNCTVLGVTLLIVQKEFNFIESVTFALGAGIGFAIALLVMAGIREKLDDSKVPLPLRGIPIALIIAGILALAFSGFAGGA